jgi:PEP-CTERM motif
MKTFERLLAVVALCWAPAHAALITYTDSGTFSAATPTTSFSAPSAPWAFSFQADMNPTVLEFGNGGFDFAFSNFSYSLNGSPVAITPTAIRFFTAANGGGFFICFGAQPCGNGVFPNGLGTGFGGPQLYTGTTSAPTLLAGTFSSLPFEVVVNSTAFPQANTTLQAAAAPEPSTLLTLAAGLLALVGTRVYVRRQRT